MQRPGGRDSHFIGHRPFDRPCVRRGGIQVNYARHPHGAPAEDDDSQHKVHISSLHLFCAVYPNVRDPVSGSSGGGGGTFL